MHSKPPSSFIDYESPLPPPGAKPKPKPNPNPNPRPNTTMAVGEEAGQVFISTGAFAPARGQRG